MSSVAQDDLVVLGRVTTVYGVKGWVKVLSETEPMQSILEYRPWFIKRNHQDWQLVTLVAGKQHGKGLVVQFEGSDDRNFAAQYRGALIAVPKDSLPPLDEDEVYWHQLEGLKVLCKDANEQEILLGRVDHLMSTGSNDVLVVKSCPASIDTRERLLPYLVGQVIQDIDLQAGELRVDWDPEF